MPLPILPFMTKTDPVATSQRPVGPETPGIQRSSEFATSLKSAQQAREREQAEGKRESTRRNESRNEENRTSARTHERLNNNVRDKSSRGRGSEAPGHNKPEGSKAAVPTAAHNGKAAKLESASNTQSNDNTGAIDDNDGDNTSAEQTSTDVQQTASTSNAPATLQPLPSETSPVAENTSTSATQSQTSVQEQAGQTVGISVANTAQLAATTATGSTEGTVTYAQGTLSATSENDKNAAITGFSSSANATTLTQEQAQASTGNAAALPEDTTKATDVARAENSASGATTAVSQHNSKSMHTETSAANASTAMQQTQSAQGTQGTPAPQASTTSQDAVARTNAPPNNPVVSGITPSEAGTHRANDVNDARPTPPTQDFRMPTPSETARQLVHVIRPLRHNANGDYSISMLLRPEQLGEVQISLKLKDGQVSLVLQAENPAAREALKNSLSELRTDLERSGFQSGSLDVGAGETGKDAESGQSGQFSAPVFTESADTSDIQESILSGIAAAVSEPLSDGSLDVRV